MFLRHSVAVRKNLRRRYVTALAASLISFQITRQHCVNLGSLSTLRRKLMKICVSVSINFKRSIIYYGNTNRSQMMCLRQRKLLAGRNLKLREPYFTKSPTKPEFDSTSTLRQLMYKKLRQHISTSVLRRLRLNSSGIWSLCPDFSN